MTAEAFILAAGFGTRLRPLTLDRPKPLVPVCGRPVLDQSLALCRTAGISSVILNAHHLADQIIAYCEQVSDLDLHVQVEHPEILGTGGGLKAARDKLSDRFVVLNGDILCDAPVRTLLDLLDDETLADMLLRRNEEAERFGIVATDTTGRVVRLVDLAKAQAQGLVDESTHFTGIHALSRQVLDDLPPGFSCIVRTAYTRLVPTRSVAGLDLVENNAATIGRWFDIGNPQDYLEANRAVLRGSLSLPHDPRPEAARWLDTGEESGQWLGPIWIGEGAVVHPSARLGPDVVIGANATIGANAQLRDSVVWDGVQVASGARLRRCVAHDSGVLHVAD